MASSLRGIRQVAPLLCRPRPATLAASHQYTRWLQPAPARRQARLSSTIESPAALAANHKDAVDTSSLEPDRLPPPDLTLHSAPSTPIPNSEIPTKPTPWYLDPETQADTQNEAPSTQSQSQQPPNPRHALPALPESPPPILLPLLQNLSTEQGLDDLTLLDLRTLDPPPALGSNLLMLLCTARSEKHVHVSADRVCRFLGSVDSSQTSTEGGAGIGVGAGTGTVGYRGKKLKPVADGLLGRHELRLRLKRKAKRNRIMSAGGQGPGYLVKDERGEVDDGLRTGWVCVNVGRVEGGELEGGKGSREEVVGFNEDEGGSRIVIQIMTEEKRGQLQLEELWQGMLNQNQRNNDEQRLEQHFA